MDRIYIVVDGVALNLEQCLTWVKKRIQQVHCVQIQELAYLVNLNDSIEKQLSCFCNWDDGIPPKKIRHLMKYVHALSYHLHIKRQTFEN